MSAHPQADWTDDDEMGDDSGSVRALHPPAPHASADPASWTRYERAAKLLTAAALASCWLGPLGLALSIAALATGLLARARLHGAGQSTGTTWLALTFAFVALLVSTASTPVVVGSSIDHWITPMAKKL